MAPNAVAIGSMSVRRLLIRDSAELVLVLYGTSFACVRLHVCHASLLCVLINRYFLFESSA
jgi:hypothetical protein